MIEKKNEKKELTEQDKKRGRFMWLFDSVNKLWPHPVIGRSWGQTETVFRHVSNLCFSAEKEVLDLAVTVLKKPSLAIAALRGSRGNLGQLYDDLIALRDGLKTMLEVTNPELFTGEKGRPEMGPSRAKRLDALAGT